MAWKTPGQRNGGREDQDLAAAVLQKRERADNTFPLFGPERGNFNVSDRIVTRHMPAFSGPTPASSGKGRTNIAYLDGHVASPLYSWQTSAYTLFRQIGFPGSDGGFLSVFMVHFPRPW